MKRIPTLDGWRGIAILLVLFDHTQAALFGRYYKPWMQTGQHGVTVFFVLSGFLITSKLLEGPIHLGKFYVRRLFRLMPVVWSYLLALWVYGRFSGENWVSRPELASCLLFYRNYFGPGRSLYVSHFWSLAIEEQFYLVWPCLLLLAGLRRSRWFAASAAVAIALYRQTHWLSYDRLWLSFRTEVRADALLVGCLLAILLADPFIRARAERVARFVTIPAIAATLLAITQFHWLPPLFESISIAALIAVPILNPGSRLVPILTAPRLAWIGTLSYSIYVWQQFFFVHRGPAITFPLIFAMPAFAVASYYWIEQPSARLGRRLTQRSMDTLVAPQQNGKLRGPSGISTQVTQQ